MKQHTILIYFILILVSAVFQACSSGDKVIYISPQGNDHNAGTLNKPLKTIKQAAERLKELGSEGKYKSLRVKLREGTYYLSETLEFTDKDFGKGSIPVEFSAYREEKVSVSGFFVPGCKWEYYRDGIYRTELAGMPDKDFSQLFVNGKRQTRARYPNGTYLQPGRESFIYPLKADEWPHEKIWFNPGTFSENHWIKPEEAIIHIFPNHHWGNLQYRVKGINYEENYISIKQRDPQINETFFKTWNGRPGTWISERSNYFIDNVFEELDDAGEWYFDKVDSYLYYLPFDTVDIKTALIELPMLDQLIAVSGTDISPVSNIVFRGIRFSGARVSYMDDYEYPSLGDWGIVRKGAVFIEGAENIAIENCFFDAPGGNAIFINNYARSINVTGNIFTECGESAVCLVGESHLNFDKTYDCGYCGATHKWGWGKPSSRIPAECIIDNNLIYDIGVYGKQVAGVFMSVSSNNTISHNHIFNTPRAGICINDGWYGGHIIEYNDIHNTVLETGDHGPFNSWGRESSWCWMQSHGQGVSHPAGDVLRDAVNTTVLRNNRFTDNSGWGIDLDDGSSNYHVYNNLCVGVSIKLREGDYRIVENNIFYKGASPPSFHRGYEENSDIFRSNIIVVDSLRYNPTEDINFKSGIKSESLLHFIGIPENSRWLSYIDSNLYFSSSGEFYVRLNAGGRNAGIESGRIGLDEWRVLGYDIHSNIGDPLFVDPEAGNFHLTKGSPAPGIGFKEFPLDQFGLREDFPNAWF